MKKKLTKQEKKELKQLEKARNLTLLFNKSCDDCLTQDCNNCKILDKLFEKKMKKVIY